MAGNLKVNSIQLGDHATATNNFVWQTNVDGTAKLARGNVGSTTQDIMTIDAAGNMSAGLQRIIHRGNLLGTASQSGGVPTGAVIERGSNANGEYVRFADGTLICVLTPFTGYAANTTIAKTPPAAYVGYISASLANLPAGAVDATCIVWGESSMVSFRSSTGSAVNVVTIAVVSRWF